MNTTMGWITAMLGLTLLCAFIFLTTTAHAVTGVTAREFFRTDNYGEVFRRSYVTGFLSGLFASGMKCPIGVSGNMLYSTVEARFIADPTLLDQPVDKVLVDAASQGLGCSASWGTRGMKREAL